MSEIKSPAVLIKKLSNLSDFQLPTYQSDEAAGVDLSASIEEPVKILPWEKEIVPCVCIKIPICYLTSITYPP